MIKKSIIFLFILCFALSVYAQSIYYFETFNSWTTYTQNGWNPDYRYGRDGVFYPASFGGGGNNLPSTNDINGGQMRLYGTPNNGVLAYNNYWVGRTTKFIPQNCPSLNQPASASSEHPFGFQIIRYSAILDPDEDFRAPAGYHQGTINVWLIEDQAQKTNEWDTLDNYTYFMEKHSGMWDAPAVGGDNSGSRLGYFMGSEVFPLTSSPFLKGPDNSSNDFSGWSRVYDDNAGGGNSYWNPPGIANENTDRLGIKIIHNGSEINLYLNPNPIDGDGSNDAQPNSWFLLGTVGAGWNTNLAVMIGHENLYFYWESLEAIYDNFLIRSVASNIKAEISPVQVRKSSLIDFTLEIKGVFSSNDSGIGELLIKKPTGYGNWNYANINIYTNNSIMGKILNSDSNPVAGNVALITNGSELKIRFNKTSGAANDIIDFYNNKVIRVEFSLTVPSTPDATGKEFEIYANNEKYPDTGGDITLNAGGIRYSTTGWQKAIARDAGTIVNTSSLIIKVFNDPNCFAGITVAPTPVYEDNSGTVPYTYYYEFSTTGILNAPDISKLIINYPSGTYIAASNVSSLLLLDDANNIYVSNNQVIIDYLNDFAGKLPSPNGYDRITITGYGTPDLPLNTFITDYLWSSIASSEGIVTGSSNQFTSTNSTYPSQAIEVIITSPEITCSVDLTNGVGVPRISNGKKTNTFIYTVYNTGTTKVLKLKLNIPLLFTNAYNFSSSIIGTNISFVKASNILYIDYLSNGTNLLSVTNNNVDNIVLHLVHNRDIPDPLTNVNIVCYADNGNTEGWIKGSASVAPGWDIEVTPPNPKGQSSIETNIIFTTISSTWDTNILYYKIYNNGAVGNNLGKAKIFVPSSFDIISIKSSHISNEGLWISVLSNIITINYAADPNGVLKSYLETSSEKDIITITLRHQITSPTNFLFNCQVSNISKSNWADTTEYPDSSKILNIEYPPVKATAYVVVDADPMNNIIDSSTATNALTYAISNKGKIGNSILKAYIYIPLAISTNVLNILSSKINDDSSYIYYDKNTGIINLNYSQDINGPLLGGEIDTITFQMIDFITGEGMYTINSKASNNREQKNCELYSGKSFSIAFDIPDADAAGGLGYKYIYTSSSPQIETVTFKVTNRGKGSNYLKKVKIIFPSLFNGKVISIHSSYLNTTSPQPYLNVQNSFAEIQYDLAGNELVSSSIDILTLTYTNDFVNTNTVFWDLNVDNGDGKGYVSTKTITNMTKTMKIIVPADIDISPSVVYTISTNINFTYIIHNGEGTKSVPVKKAKVYIPYPFSINDMTLYSDTWTGALLSIVSNYILIDYTLANLSAGGQDVLTMVFSKISNAASSDALFDCRVDYGYSKELRSTTTLPGKTNVVSVIIPPAQSHAYSEPNNIGKDILSSDYTIYIKNTAGPGNLLYQAKITPPDFITNISFITSDYIADKALYSNNIIFLKYYQYNTNINSSGMDKIRFRGMDSINTVTQGTWKVEVNNSTNTNGFSFSSVYPGKSLSLELYQPSYNAYSYISPKGLDTTYTVNRITINIKNVSGDASRINKAKIQIPSVFITNNLMISNNRAASYFINANEIIIDYSASNNTINPNEDDTIILYIKDTINKGQTNCIWIISANYNTSGLIYITNNITPGKSISNYFYMPDPDYRLGYNTEEIYTTTTNFRSIIDITNSGTGTHEIKQVSIDIPQILTNNFSIGDISSGKAANIQKTNNTVFVTYTNFLPGLVDQIILSFINQQKTVISESFTVIISNGYNLSTNQLPINITTPASASINPTNIWSTAYSNNFTLLIKNDGSGIKSIKHAIALLPSFITNLKNLTSFQSALMKFTNNKLILDYSSSPIIDGDYDSISFTAEDSLTLEETNIIIDVTISNSFGNSLVSRDSTNNLKINFNVPHPEASAYLLNPLYIFTTKPTNLISIVITNYGKDLNEIQKAVIQIPTGMTLAGFVQSSHIINSTNIKNGNNTSITLFYSSDANGNIKYHETDLITMKLFHSFAVKTNVTFKITGDNGKNTTQIMPDLNNTLSLKIKYPEWPSKFYIDSPEVIYTIDTNVWISFNVGNSSYDNELLQLYISEFPTNILKINKIDSQFVSSNNFSFFSNYLLIDYSSESNIPPNTKDKLRINISYHYDQSTNFKLAGKAIFYGNTDKIALTNDYPNHTDILSLLISDFGRIVGKITPKGVSAVVELLDLNNKHATNKNGDFGQATINPDTGQYMIDLVLPGVYNLRFVSDDFRDTYYQRVVVYSNKYNVVEQVRLRNRILNNEEKTTRIIYADDDISYIEFPEGSVLDDFYLDIYKINIKGKEYTKYIDAIGKNESIQSPENSSKINIFNFSLEDADEESIDEVEIGEIVTIVLHYTDAELKKQAWDEDSLAIYYYKENTGEWVKLGGKIDKKNNTITIKVNYLHSAYAVFGSKEPEYVKSFGDLKCWPNPFTPGRGGNIYENLKISFIFKEPVEDFQFAVYDLVGRRIILKEYSGKFAQGEIFWDGTDENGFFVKSGVYIYQIETKKEYYRGKVMILK